MKSAHNGFANKILIVDLTKNEVKTENLSDEIKRNFLGGKGIGIYYLYRDLKAGVDPLSAENEIIFSVGPLTGTNAPTAGRFCVTTKSPATGTYMDAYCGGFLGQTIKFAGYDAIVIRGKAKEPVYFIIDNEKVEIKDAKNIWGKKVQETNKYFKEKYGNDFQTAVVGPAGERGSRISGIFSGLRTAGRGGGGAVMGSKNLKGFAVRGTGDVKVFDKTEFEEAVWIAHRALRMSSQIKRLKETGTDNILKLVNAAGALPTRNFQLGQFSEAEEVAGEKWRKEFWKKDIACYGCPIACSKIAYSEKFKITIDGPDYETIFALGTNCGVSDRDAIVYANYICDDYGIDTISTGNIIAFVMELYQKGMIGKDELDGIEAKWGSGDALVQLTEKMAKGEGVGVLLEKGVREISKQFPGSEEFAMQVKGLEMPGYLPRAAKGIALSYAISERGACHLRGSPLTEILGGADPLQVEGKAALFRSNQLDSTVVNTMILCYFVKFGMTLKEIYQMINPCTGFEYSHPRDLEEIAERIINITRLFNLRDGFTSKDDVLPKRSLQEPLPSGPGKGEVVDLDTLKSEYYRLMGWDENGVPKEETLKKLGITEMF
ncbi:MAG: aldehyde ferredoxin oxidoreductase family protein [Calditrichaeota bacterium]|nr:aldehyde ferredoxin oxidoreductase family protein [Calditrichota bacterium]